MCWPWVKEKAKVTTNRQSQYSLTRDLREENPRRLWDPQEGCLAQGRGPREGDIYCCYEKRMGISKTKARLGWAKLRPERGLEQMVETAWSACGGQ